MLRCMEPPEANRCSGRWLQVVGWGIEWGDDPSYCSPIFHSENIKDDFHWSLYSRFTSKKAEQEFISCALVEVVQMPPSYYWRSTGRVRLHPNLPEYMHCLCRDERQAWLRDNRPPNVTELSTQAIALLRKLSESDWFRSSVPEDCPDLSQMESILEQLPDAELRRHLRSPKVRDESRRKRYELMYESST